MPAKLERCVKKVAKSHSKSSAFAICTASLQRSGAMKKKRKGKKKGY